MSTIGRKSIKVKLTLKGLAGIIVDSSRVKSQVVKAFVQIVHDDKLYATSSLSLPLKKSPAERADSKVKRYVAIWDDNEKPLTFETTSGNFINLQIFVQMPNGKQFQIGVGNLIMPVYGAADLSIWETPGKSSSLYCIDPSGDARLRIHAVSEEKETGMELNTSRGTASSLSSHVSCDPPEIRQRSVKSVDFSCEQNDVNSIEPFNQSVVSCSEFPFEPSIEQEFIPDYPHNAVPESIEKKNKKKQSPLAKLFKRSSVLDWGRKKKKDETTSKTETILISKKNEETPQMKKRKDIVATETKMADQVERENQFDLKKTGSRLPKGKEEGLTVQKTEIITTMAKDKDRQLKKSLVQERKGVLSITNKLETEVKTQRDKDILIKNTSSTVQASSKEKLVAIKKAESESQVLRYNETQLNKMDANVQEGEVEKTSMKTPTLADQVHKENKTSPMKIESTTRIQTSEEAWKYYTPSKEIADIPMQTPVVENYESESFVFPTSAWTPSESSAFVSLQKKTAFVTPDRTCSFVTTKTANSTPFSAGTQRGDPDFFSAQQDDVHKLEVLGSPHLLDFDEPDFSKGLKKHDGFEEVDFVSFPAIHSPQLVASSRKVTKSIDSPPRPLERIEQQHKPNEKDDSFHQNDNLIPLSQKSDQPANVTDAGEESYETLAQECSKPNRAPPTTEKQMPKMDVDDYSLFSRDDTAFLPKPRELFSMIKCCIMSDEDTIYDFDEALTFDDTVGEDSTVDSYANTFVSDTQVNSWWCQDAFSKTPDPYLARKRQLWKDRMQQLADKNASVKEIFESQRLSQSKLAGTFDDDEDSHDERQKEAATMGKIQDHQRSCASAVDCDNSQEMGMTDRPIISPK